MNERPSGPAWLLVCVGIATFMGFPETVGEFCEGQGESAVGEKSRQFFLSVRPVTCVRNVTSLKLLRKKGKPLVDC